MILNRKTKAELLAEIEKLNAEVVRLTSRVDTQQSLAASWHKKFDKATEELVNYKDNCDKAMRNLKEDYDHAREMTPSMLTFAVLFTAIGCILGTIFTIALTMF